MRSKIIKIKWILMDVDGVMTDGSISYTSAGQEIKTFNVQDGAGIVLARKAGLKTGIITGRESEMVKRRVQDLKYDYFKEGVKQKLSVYLDFLNEYQVTDEQVCFIGDDFPDLGILQRVGLSVAPANARDEVKAVCDYVTITPGGSGAVREVMDKILKGQEKLFSLVEEFKQI